MSKPLSKYDQALAALVGVHDQCIEAAEYEDDFGTPEAALAFRRAAHWIEAARRMAIGAPPTDLDPSSSN